MKILKIEPFENKPSAYDKITIEITRDELRTIYESIELTAHRAKDFSLVKRAVFAHEHLKEAMTKTQEKEQHPR